VNLLQKKILESHKIGTVTLSRPFLFATVWVARAGAALLVNERQHRTLKDKRKICEKKSQKNFFYKFCFFKNVGGAKVRGRAKE